MALLPIIETPDPRLRTISKPVTVFDKTLDTLIEDMLETMYHADGIGLAAIQVGQPLRLITIDLQEYDPLHEHLLDNDSDSDSNNTDSNSENTTPPPRNPRVFINPVLSDPAPDLAVYKEGCLSVPTQYAEVKRPAEITVDWVDSQNKPHRQRMSGLLATCIQHEYDHLEGILFVDHLSRLKREMLLKKLAKARKAA